MTLKLTLFTLLAGFALFASAADIDHPAEKRHFNLPPSADLSYSIKAQQSGLQLSGNALLRWSADGNKFRIDTETRAVLIGKIDDAKTEGTIDEYGWAPVSFTEKRFRKDATTTSFDHVGKQITFSTNSDSYPIIGGEQDRNSAIWQLVAIARGSHGRFRPNSVWQFFVAGPRDAERWTFKVSKQEDIRTPMGTMSTVHVIKLAPDGKGQQVDIWLAPSLEWYPVRLRYVEPNGDFIEQQIDNVSKSAG